MVYIVIPVHNRRETTRNILSLLRTQTLRDFKIVVVDCGSEDGTSVMIKSEFPEVRLLEEQADLFWTGAVNKGIKSIGSFSEGDHILTLNDDILIKEDYLYHIMQSARDNPGALIGSAQVDRASENIFSRCPQDKTPPGADVIKYFHVNELCGRGMLIPAAVFNKIGLFDEAFPHYASDGDFSLRAKKAGYDLIISIRAAVFTDVGDKKRYHLGVINPIEYLKWIFSIKNPFNIQNRYLMNKKHKKWWPLTFASDLLRILTRYPRNVWNAFLAVVFKGKGPKMEN